MAVVVGDFVRLTCKFLFQQTDERNNVFLYRIDRNDTLSDLAFMTEAALLFDVAYTLINARISDGLDYVSIDGQNISKDELLPEVPWPVLVSGLDANDDLPGPVAALAFWPTTTPKVRTSSYVAGMTTNSMGTGGGVTANAVAALQNWADALTLWNTVDVDGVKGSFNPTKLLFTQAGAAKIQPRFRTQRRRRVGVGS